jgi:epoxyqueuosine reductase
MEMSKKTQNDRIRDHALRIGFDACGISKVRFLEKEARQLESFLKQNHHGKMEWLERNFEKRTNPALLVEGARSVISVIASYHPNPLHRQPEDAPKISAYAWGRDYHLVLKEKLGELLHCIRTDYGDVNARIFVDSAPVMDKVWAQNAGLGWIGKHTNLIRKRMGSWFFIGEIITDLVLEQEAPATDHCGTCTRCIDACPTEALQPYAIDARKCISYLTIELKEAMPEDVKIQTQGWAFGCDICQQVCPWNTDAAPHTSQWFQPLPFILTMDKRKWEELDAPDFKQLVKASPMSRIKPGKWKSNF